MQNQSRYKFIEWLDIDGSGLLSEVAIIKRFPNGDVYFIPLQSLDTIDLGRLKMLISHQDAHMYEDLWRLLEQRTLGNGMNALLYFNQLVKHRTPNGQILNFGSGKISYAPRVEPTAQVAQPTVQVAQPVQAPVEAQVESFDNLAKPAGPKAK